MLLLDAGASMSRGSAPRLPDAKAALNHFVVQKVLAGKKSDEVALVVFGSEETRNQMNVDVSVASETPNHSRVSLTRRPVHAAMLRSTMATRTS